MRLAFRQRANKVALALGGTSLAVYALMAFSVTGPEHTMQWLIGYAIAWGLYLTVFLVAEDDDWIASPWVILGWTLLARLVLVGTPPWLSDDLYRYLLDGRMLAEGVNPFRYAPADPAVHALVGDLALKVNHPEVPTIYPPLVQAVAFAAAKLSLGIIGWRVMMSVVDLALVALVARLFGRGPGGWRAAAVYGLCPLAVWETGANGHLEPLVAVPLVLAVTSMAKGHPWRAGLSLALAILGKYYALLLLPLFVRQRGFWAMATATVGVSALAIWPFTFGGVDVFAGLRTYLAHWTFNSPVHAALAALGVGDTLLRALPFAVVGLAATVAGLRREDVVRTIPLMLFAFLVIGPTLHPWYALWLLPWLGARPHPGHWSFVAAMGGAYAVWWSVYTTGVWELPPGVAEMLWSIVALGWLISYWHEEGSTPEPA